VDRSRLVRHAHRDGIRSDRDGAPEVAQAARLGLAEPRRSAVSLRARNARAPERLRRDLDLRRRRERRARGGSGERDAEAAAAGGPGRQPLAGDRPLHRAVRELPAHRAMVRGLSLLVEELDVVPPTLDERDRGGTLARRLVPGPLLDRARLEGDPRLLIRVLARAQIEVAI